MANLIIAMLGSLVFLLIVAVYSAVFVGRKTDDMISVEEDGAPIVVRFPEAVLRVTGLGMPQR